MNQVGMRVQLIYAPVGWVDVTGHIIPDPDGPTEGWVLVEWNNGETCYERPKSLQCLT